MIARLQNRLPTLRAVHLLLAPALIFIAACLDRQYQTDFWHHLARGQQIVGHGRLVDVDLFTFTVAGQPLRDANWLTQVIYWRLFAWGGLNLVQVVNAGLLAITLLILVRICLRDAERTPAERGAKGKVPSRAAAIAGAAVFLGLCPFALIRPQTGSFLLFVLLLGLLLNRRRNGGHPRAVWLAVPIMALWANVHGGFAIGLLLIGAFCLEATAALISLSLSGRGRGEGSAGPESSDIFLPPFGGQMEQAESFGLARPSPHPLPRREREKRAARAEFGALLLLLCLSVAATCLNPYGWAIYQYATTVTARAAGRGIEEWLPPTLASAGGWVLLLWLGVLGIGTAARRRRPKLIHIFLLTCFVPLACRSVRMVPWLLLATAPMMAEVLAGAGEWWESICARHAAAKRQDSSASKQGNPAAARRRGAGMESSLSSGMLLLILLAAMVLSLPWLANVNPIFGRVRSNHRVEDDLAGVKNAMAARGPGNVFTRLEWGDYLSFAAHGENPVFCDGRIELYPDSLWQQYLHVSAGRPDFQQILDDWAVDYLVLDDQYHGILLEQIGRNGSWKTVWRSGHVVLLTRTNPLVASGHARNFSSQSIADTR